MSKGRKSDGVLLEARELKKTYGNGEEKVEALRGASLRLNRGDTVSIFGPSGSGKSTFLHLLGGLDRPTSGEILFEDQHLAGMDDEELARFRNRKVGFVFQFHHLMPEFSALENVAMPLLIAGVVKKEAFEQAGGILEEVGLGSRKEFSPIKLSGGEKQRVAVARALVHNPSLVLADEPTGNLDSETEKGVMEMFSRLNRSRGITLVIVSHDPFIKHYTDKSFDLIDGRL